MTDGSSIRRQVDQAIRQLKDFQRATVDVVYQRLFEEGRARMLVADEVGLGKTIVAKGVIARRLRSKLDQGDSSPLRVTYICSNQVIGQENIRKLDLSQQQHSVDRLLDRLAFLAFEPQSASSSPLRLNTLTPATSFRSSGHAGHQRERKILYTILLCDELLRDVPTGVACLLRGSVQRSAESWAKDLEEERRSRLEGSIRAGLPRRFLDHIRSAPLAPAEFPSGVPRLADAISLYEAVLECACTLTFENHTRYARASLEIIRQLRKALADLCVEYIDADLYILDEFQRFRDLIDEESGSEAADIARRIFTKPNTRVLLLSATPFKAFSGATDLEWGDEHYREFRTVLSFLMQGDAAALKEYETHRQALFKQLLTLGPEVAEIDPSHRAVVEGILRSVMCRTERMSVSKRRDAMTSDKWRDGPVPLHSAEIRAFVATDALVQAVNGTIDRAADRLHPPVEFCKSAPCPLSFLDDYKLKKLLKERRNVPGVRANLDRSKGAWLDHGRIDNYSLVVGGNTSPAANARFELLVREAIPDGAEALLWIPPSLPYYPLSGAFAGKEGFSKTLVFSGWLMVPRMAASLLSYEVERRTVGNPASQDLQEKEPRRYFAPEGGRRHPIPQLVYRTDSGGEPSNMTNFVLLYPSLTLADMFQPSSALARGQELADVEAEIAARVRELAERLDLRQFEQADGEPDRWYWAAPALLDRSNPAYRAAAQAYLHMARLQPAADGNEDDARDSSRSLHLHRIVQAFTRPDELRLGPMPTDLFEVLAQTALGSPAVATLRTLRSLYGGENVDLCFLASSVADEFADLFNKPEAIAAVRMAVRGRVPFWQRLLRYCRDGCLQAVLDEYLHLLKAECDAADGAAARLKESVTLKTTSINVDDLASFRRDKPRKMRCHFAVDLGNQRIETEEGTRRVTNIRQTFNSPFRPFVLATTSIGQEGLDFHQYCRKVVHWNLPSNPIDLEQREGRVNRYKGHVIRLHLAQKYRPLLSEDELRSADVWEDVFRVAEVIERGPGASEIIPYWHVDIEEHDPYRIERIIPLYPFSRDRAKLRSLLRSLAIYRLAFGQPRQSELVEHLLKNVPPAVLEQVRSRLLIDLSPISYRPSQASLVPLRDKGGEEVRVRVYGTDNEVLVNRGLAIARRKSGEGTTWSVLPCGETTAREFRCPPCVIKRLRPKS